jgi:hypothetical protein
MYILYGEPLMNKYTGRVRMTLTSRAIGGQVWRRNGRLEQCFFDVLFPFYRNFLIFPLYCNRSNVSI